MKARLTGWGVAAAVLAFGVILVMVLWAAVLLKVQAEHAADLQNAFKHSANLARAAEEHAVRTFREADQVLLFVRHQYGVLGRALDLRALLDEGAILSTFYAAIGIIDEQGDLILGSRPFAATSVADRDYFRVHAATSADRPFISTPIIGRVTGEPLLQLSRRISRPDGSFGGVAAVALNPGYFSGFYGQLDVGSRGMATLVGNDRVVRAQRAGSRLSAAPDARNWAVFEHLEKADSGGYVSASAIDGERRIFSYRSVKEYPLVAVIGVLEREVLADFFERRRNYYLGAALISAVILAMTAMLVAMTLRQARMANQVARQNAELAGAERRFEELFRASPVPSRIFTDAGGITLDCNAAFCALVGIAREDMLGRTSAELGYFADAAVSREIGRRMRAGHRVDGTEQDVVPRGGGRRRVALTAMPLAWQGTQAWISQYMDVTERQQAEQAMRSSREQLEALFRNSPTATRVFADADYRTLDCNAAFCSLSGFTREELLGRTLRELGLFVDDENNRAILARMRAEGGLDGVEADLISRGGILRRNLLHMRPVEWQGEKAWIAQLVDISGRVQAEAALRQSEARFASLFHNSLVPQAVSDPRSRVVEDANQAYLDLTGYAREQFVASTGPQLGLYWDADDEQKVAAIHAQGGTASPVEVKLRRADGRQRITLVTAVSIETGAGPRVAWSLVDVTEQRDSQRLIREMNEDLERTVARRTDELSSANLGLKQAIDELKSSQDALLRSEKLAALGRLVAGVAHELNTPIGNSLLSATTLAEHADGFAEEVGRGGLKRSTLAAFVAMTREAAQILHRNLEKAAELIRSFKQIAADQASSQRRGFALDEVVHEVLLAHRPMLKRSPIGVRAEVPAGIRMDSYPGPLGQVLGNLITNAVLHGYEGRKSGAVVVSAGADGEEWIEISVRDWGRGIAEADLKRIFDPFFTTRMGRGGTGLGLGICHNIVTGALGGGIRVDSRPEEGATFVLRLPRVAPGAQGDREAA